MRAIISSTLTRLLFLAIVIVLAPMAALAGYGAVRLFMDVTGRDTTAVSADGVRGDTVAAAADADRVPSEFESTPDRIARRAREAWSGFADAVAGRDTGTAGDATSAESDADAELGSSDIASASPAPRPSDPLPASTLDVLSLPMPEPTRTAPVPTGEARRPDPRNTAFDDWVARARVFEAPPQHLVRYGWSWDDHSSRIVRFEGDRAVVDRNRKATRYEIEVPIDVSLAEELEAHFGFPRHALAFWYRSPEELLERLDAQQYALEACGMRFVPADGSRGELNMPRDGEGARERGGHEIADQCIEIADDQEEDPASRRVRVETRLKLLAKWHPTRYGEQSKLALTGPDGGAIKTEAVGVSADDMRKLTEALLQRPTIKSDAT